MPFFGSSWDEGTSLADLERIKKLQGRIDRTLGALDLHEAWGYKYMSIKRVRALLQGKFKPNKRR